MKAEILGVLILLGLYSVRKSLQSMEHQHVMKLHDLMTCQCFEIIECFLHVVTPNEEEAAFGDRLRKLRPFMEHLKSNCFILSATPAIGTLCTNCVGVPTSVVDVKIDKHINTTGPFPSML